MFDEQPPDIGTQMSAIPGGQFADPRKTPLWQRILAASGSGMAGAVNAGGRMQVDDPGQAIMGAGRRPTNYMEYLRQQQMAQMNQGF